MKTISLVIKSKLKENMNPLAKCCGIYCACLMITGIVFFAILITMLKNNNKFLSKGTPEENPDRITALLIAIGVNAVCFVSCVLCVISGTRKEAQEDQRRQEEERERASKGLDIF